MKPVFHCPGPPLGALVECFWNFPSYRVEHDRERALPTGTMEIVFNLGPEAMCIFRDETDVAGQRFDHAVVCGPHSRYFVLDTSKPGPALGIHFRPGGAVTATPSTTEPPCKPRIPQLDDVLCDGR